MEWVETTGKSVEEAKDLALDQLGVDENDAEFEVLSEPKMGLFGRVKAEARVRARVRPSTPRAKDTGNRRKRRNERERPARSTPKGATATADSEDEGTGEAPSEPETAGTQRRNRSKNSDQRRRPRPTPDNEGASAMEEEVALAEQGDVARDFVSGLLDQVGASAGIDVSIDDEDEIINLAVEGENLGHLIGPRGVTLHALQELTRTVVQRKTGARNGRLVVDIARYREKRRVALEGFTRQVAEEVVASGAQRVLEPMNPADRKVVHDAANEIDGVITTSEGEEPRRRVVIKPAGSA